MNENASKITPEYLIDLIIRRRWIILLPLCFALTIGTYLSVELPRIYEAKTLILIEPQRVPQQFVQSIVTIEPGERINTLSQQILSRTNLEKMINEFNLFNDPKQMNMFMEDKVAILRKQISIDVVSDSRRGTDAFSITLRGKDPQKIATVANGLATSFIDENLKVRESQALGTSDFLDSELNSMRNRLEQVEEKIKDYRKTYMGELPEQLDTNLRILDRLQENMNDRQQSVREARARLAELNGQASSRPQQVLVIGNEQGANNNTGAASIEELKSQLETLRSRYTEKHPDIQRLIKLIAELEGKQKTEAQNGKSIDAAPIRLSPQLRTQIADVQREIQSTEAEIGSLKGQIAEYQKRVEATPKREQELLGLRRDYQNIQASYDSLLGRKLEADIAVNMERKQKGEQFRIVDSAKPSQIPVAPDMRKLFLFVVVAGIGSGGGAAFLLEYLKPSFRKAEDIEEMYDLPVLAAIPRVLQPRQQFFRKLNFITSITFSLITLATFALFALVCFVGSEQLFGAIRRLT